MNPEALLALIADLYAQVVGLRQQMEAVAAERDTYKQMCDAARSEPDA